MAKTTQINSRVEPGLKAEAETILKEVGISTSDAITMFLRQVVLRRGLPFEARIPNAETVAALKEPPDALLSFSSVEEMMAHVDAMPEESDKA